MFKQKFEDTPLPESDDELNEDDEDTVNEAELQQRFQLKYSINDESAVSLKDEYVLHLCNDKGFTKIIAGLSNGSVQIYDVNTSSLQLTHSNDIDPPKPTNTAKNSSICGVQFMDETSNSLIVGTRNGLVRLYDLRTMKEEGRINCATVGNTAPIYAITCFDCDLDNNVVCIGTEQNKENSYLIFYDMRERTLMGGYYESHLDDITSVKYHPDMPYLLCSGSTDGLLNVYDIREGHENKSLLTTMNTESSIDKLNWHDNYISCITHTHDLKIYDPEHCGPVFEFKRKEITKAAHRKNQSNCNPINAHSQDNGIFLLFGTNFDNGSILRSLKLENNKLTPQANFHGNKQIVRDSLYHAESKSVVTAGENGFVTLWTLNTALPSITSKLKSKSTHGKNTKSTPY